MKISKYSLSYQMEEKISLQEDFIAKFELVDPGHTK